MDNRGRARPARSIAFALALSACTVGAVAAGQSFDGQGRVTAVDPGGRTVTIDHGGIPGLLSAARSEFPVSSAGALEGVGPGDRVRFTLSATDESHGLLAIQSITPEVERRAGLNPLFVVVPAALVLLTLAAAAAAGVRLWRELQSLNRRVVALDHEAASLRGLVSDTQDGMLQMARALDEAVAVLRVGYLQELRRRLVPGSSPPTADASNGDDTGALVIVQRGRGELYYAVERGAAGPGLAVIWDRRRAERRRAHRHLAGHERRRNERRRAPPETWTHLGFQLVPVSAADAVRAPHAVRPASGERGAAH